MDPRAVDQLESFPLAGQVSQCLEGAVFPLRGDQVVRIARDNGAPTQLMTLFSRLGTRTYRSLDEVEEAMDTPGVGSGMVE